MDGCAPRGAVSERVGGGGGEIGGSVNEGFYSSLTSLNKYKLTQQLRRINNSRRPPDTDSFCVRKRAPRRLSLYRSVDALIR